MPAVIDLNAAGGAARTPIVTLSIIVAEPHRHSFPCPQSMPSLRTVIDRAHHLHPNRRPPTLGQRTRTSIAGKPPPLSP
jgi:hypothetical protein